MGWFLHAKNHKATVTLADLDCIGSITIDEDLIEKSGLLPGEKVLVVSNTSGARLETYIIAGARESGVISTNVLVDEDSHFVRYLNECDGC